QYPSSEQSGGLLRDIWKHEREENRAESIEHKARHHEKDSAARPLFARQSRINADSPRDQRHQWKAREQQRRDGNDVFRMQEILAGESQRDRRSQPEDKAGRHTAPHFELPSLRNRT